MVGWMFSQGPALPSFTLTCKFKKAEFNDLKEYDTGFPTLLAQSIHSFLDKDQGSASRVMLASIGV